MGSLPSNKQTCKEKLFVFLYLTMQNLVDFFFLFFFFFTLILYRENENDSLNRVNSLHAIVSVYGITLPARESRFREEPCSSKQETVGEIASTIVTELGDKPFIFFGHRYPVKSSVHHALF